MIDLSIACSVAERGHRRSPGLSKKRVVYYELGRAVRDGDCIITTANLSARGYGHIRVGGRLLYLHRMVLEVDSGRDVAPGEQANHTCHRRNCINPHHIYRGTQTDNMQDMIRAGRHAPANGERNPAAKLTNDEAIAIKAMHGAGIKQVTIADVFQVSKGTVNKIVTGRTWATTL